MNRSELIAALCTKHPELKHQDVFESVVMMLEGMSNALARGDRVEVRDFGAFSIHLTNARIGRNPATGARVEVPAKPRVHFKPGKGLKDRVDQ